MPRGPDWLLGFGFMAKDRGLGAQLEKYQKQFDDLSKSVKNFQKGNRGGSGGKRSPGAGLDTEKLSKSVKSSNSRSMLRGLESLNEEVSSVLQNVDRGLEHVNKTGRDIGLSLHKNIEKLFDDIEKGAFKSGKNLEQIPEILTRIPLLAPKTVASLKKLHKELATNQGDHKALTGTIKGLRNEIMKAVKESSGFESVDKKGGLSQVLHSWTHGTDLFANSLEDAYQGLDFIGSKFSKKFGHIFDKPASIDGFKDAMQDLSKEIVNGYKGTIKFFTEWNRVKSVYNKVLKPFGNWFWKKLFVPSTKLAKANKNTTLIEKIFGKKAKLKGTRQELDRIGEDLSFADELSAFNKATGAGASEKDFAEKLAGDQLELADRMAEAQKLGSKDLAKAMASSAADDPMTSIMEAIEKAQVQAAPEPDKVAEKIAEAIAVVTKDDSGPSDISNAVSELIAKLKFDVAPAVADELAAITNLFMHGRKNIGEEALSLNKVISDSFSAVQHAYIEPLARSVGQALDEAKQKVSTFSADLKKEIEGSVSESFTKLRERVNRTARTFHNLTKNADEAFFNILLDKEEFVQDFEANFERLAANVGLSIGKISTTTAHEFRQLEDSLRTVYSNLSTINAEGVSKQTDAISRGFVDLANTLDRITGSIVKNYEAIGAALKKAVGLNPFPVMAILSKLGPALARIGPAAGRAGAGMAGIGEAGAARGASASAEAGELFKKQAMDSAMESVSGQVMDRVGQLVSAMKGDQKETTKAAAPSGSAEGSIFTIVDAIHAQTTRLVEELHKLTGALGKQGAQPQMASVGGKMNINSDEFKKAFSGAMKTIGGLAGHAR